MAEKNEGRLDSARTWAAKASHKVASAAHNVEKAAGKMTGNRWTGFDVSITEYYSETDRQNLADAIIEKRPTASKEDLLNADKNPLKTLAHEYYRHYGKPYIPEQLSREGVTTYKVFTLGDEEANRENAYFINNKGSVFVLDKTQDPLKWKELDKPAEIIKRFTIDPEPTVGMMDVTYENLPDMPEPKVDLSGTLLTGVGIVAIGSVIHRLGQQLKDAGQERGGAIGKVISGVGSAVTLAGTLTVAATAIFEVSKFVAGSKIAKDKEPATQRHVMDWIGDRLTPASARPLEDPTLTMTP